jgi:sporulation protein YlmC with PRC-barrel domain
LRVDWITGTRVYAPDGENIGRITDLIFDQESNAISAAILSVGGFLGIGAKNIAVRFEELVIDFDAREIQLALTREEADAAPEYVFRDRAEAPAAAAPAGGTGMGTGTGGTGMGGTGAAPGEPAPPPRD